METATAVASPQKVRFGLEQAPPSSKIYAVTIFLGAFLLFQVQLIIGKYVLPWFGGTTGVWAACLLFFQCLLLAGYAYAHWLSSRPGQQTGVKIHRILIALSILTLVIASFFWRAPIMPGESWKPQGNTIPVLDILGLLMISVGAPFFLLSTTGPLIQRWFANAHPNASPYRLYALSNLGSLLGLVTYPFLFEPLFRLNVQGWLWCATYAIYAASVILCSRRSTASQAVSKAESVKPGKYEEPAPERKHILKWVGLAACASIMLLAVTQTICQDISVVPLLWVLPLCVYLISFIICFEHERWYKPGFFQLLLAAAVVSTLMVQRSGWLSLWPTIGFYLLILFACCMFCHGEVYRSRPAPRYLTSFYLSVALGGALGGIFVNLIAPLLFRGYWELQLGLFACFGAMVWMVLADKRSWANRYVLWLPLAILLWGYWAGEYLANFTYRGLGEYLDTMQTKLLLALAILVSLMAVMQLRSGEDAAARTGKYPANIPRLVKICLLLALVFAGGEFWLLAAAKYRNSLWSNRNFYGVLYVARLNAEDPRHASNVLLHGQIRHGMQLLAPDLRQVPTAYFGQQSGAGLMFLNHPRRKAQPPVPMRVGVIGLGIGTLAAYGRSGDVFRFYEINPGVIDVASKSPYFSFLSDSSAKIELVEGDARISLEREFAQGKPQQYDVLIMDAFNGDSIPVHLLTKEAFEVYLKHLRGPDSVIAVQISNRMLKLEPVVSGLARHFNMHLVYVVAPGKAPILESSRWMLLSFSKQMIDDPAIVRASSAVTEKRIPLWTDQYSNLLQLF